MTNCAYTSRMLQACRIAPMPPASSSSPPVGGMFGLYFSGADDIVTFADVMASDADRFKRFFHLMLEGGVYRRRARSKPASPPSPTAIKSWPSPSTPPSAPSPSRERADGTAAVPAADACRCCQRDPDRSRPAPLRRNGSTGAVQRDARLHPRRGQRATGLGGGLAEAQQWLERATLLLGLPLLALAALTRHDAGLEPAELGPVVLGLCVFFELARQLGWSEPYALGLLLASALLVIYAAVLQWPDRLPSGAGVAAGVLLLLMLPMPSGSAIGNPLAGAEPLLLAIASPLLALLLLRLPGSTGEQQPTAT